MEVGGLDSSSEGTAAREFLAPAGVLRRQGVLRGLDLQFSFEVGRLTGFDPESEDSALAPLLWAAALASWFLGRGHVCVFLDRVAARRFPADFAGLGEESATVAWAEAASWTLPSAAEWRSALRSPRFAAAVGGSDAATPLVLLDDAPGGGRLYLRRYWRYERDLADCLRSAAAATVPLFLSAGAVRERLSRLFPPTEGASEKLQKAAACAALRRRLTMVSGGPGTGKTHAAARILALLLENFLAGSEGESAPRVVLTAPTGKAAARLQAAVAAAVAANPQSFPEEVRRFVPQRALTIHRLLGARRGSSRFRHHRGCPLPVDLLILDEASMVPLSLMSRLFEALPGDCRLLLLGDMNQLSSVEPGYVFGDLCASFGMAAFSSEFQADFHVWSGERLANCGSAEPGSPLADCAVELAYSRRFPPDSPVGRLSAAIKAVRSPREAADALSAAAAEIVLHEYGKGAGQLAGDWPAAVLRQAILRLFAPYLQADSPESALAELEKARILCATRGGFAGIGKMNRLVERVLAEELSGGRLGFDPGAGGDYQGRPILILRNDYPLNLFNGDVGVVWRDRNRNGEAVACFRGDEDGVRRIPVSLLPERETVFATTVHKAQGGEFERMLVMLPPTDSPVLTRELIYTGITRLRMADGDDSGEGLEIWLNREVAVRGLLRKTCRSSGLAEQFKRA